MKSLWYKHNQKINRETTAMLLVTQQKVHELLIKRRDPRERNCDWVFEKLMMRWQQCKPGIAFHVALPKLASPVATAPAWKRMRQNLSREGKEFNVN